MELCTLENRQHEIRVKYMCSSITVPDVKAKRPPASEVLERKSTLSPHPSHPTRRHRGAL
ncbi:hypothetical protein EYF80_020620 [Liparis tanakae]|uniref:Uncharacterized protein n=1 Tax=Liparis tanakae TaxID=230148 RepID=A0A4Z2HW10_9TELE|nr:hypothetical protein EYF80_020620 [Liparis tanakae]